MGCYAPKETAHEYFLDEFETPTNPLTRGKYHVKMVFGDDDQGDGSLGTLEFDFNIDKDWK